MLPIIVGSAPSVCFTAPLLLMERRRQSIVFMSRVEGEGREKTSEESEFVKETRRIVRAVDEIREKEIEIEIDAEEADWKCYLRGVLGEGKEQK